MGSRRVASLVERRFEVFFFSFFLFFLSPVFFRTSRPEAFLRFGGIGDSPIHFIDDDCRLHHWCWKEGVRGLQVVEEDISAGFLRPDRSGVEWSGSGLKKKDGYSWLVFLCPSIHPSIQPGYHHHHHQQGVIRLSTHVLSIKARDHVFHLERKKERKNAANKFFFCKK